jgi:hypothetical protein
MDVAERFIELINQSGDDIKKYAEIKWKALNNF